jgi:hypothetical protein
MTTQELHIEHDKILKKNTVICSWDVGTVNLAYCVLEKDNNKETDNISINHWEVMRIFEDTTKFCECNQKNGNKCTSKASFFGKSGNDIKYYCGMHKKQHINFDQNYWQNKCIVLPKKDDNKCEYILPKKQTLCCKKATFGFYDKQYCSTHKAVCVNKKFDEYQLKPIKVINEKHLPEDTCARMYKIFDNLPHLVNVDNVLIENQPSLDNPTMKAIASFLMSYFVSKKVYQNADIKTIQFISAKNKLKINEENTNRELADDKLQTKKEKYTKRKDLGELYTAELLKDNKKWLDHLKSHKKKDDLCDAFLQGYHFLMKK